MPETTFKTVTIQHNVTLETTRNLLVSAFEGGSNYWMKLDKYICPPDTTLDDFKEGGKRSVPDSIGSTWHPAYILPTIKDGAMGIVDSENTKHTLTREKLFIGFDVMAKKYPQHFQNIVDENDDAETADVLLQCALFGELVYG